MRDPESKSALEFHNLGAELVRWDFNDCESPDYALEGIYRVFMPSFQVILQAIPKMEIQYGMALLEAAKDTGVRHFVYAFKTDAKNRPWISGEQRTDRIQYPRTGIAKPEQFYRNHKFSCKRAWVSFSYPTRCFFLGMIAIFNLIVWWHTKNSIL